MDDRIRREGSEKTEDFDSDIIREESAEVISSDKEITSDSPATKINPTASKVKRFEVHIPESSDFYSMPEKKNEVPARIPAPANRTAAARRPVPTSELAKKRPARPQSLDSFPRKKTATGSPSPVSPEAQLAAKKASEKRAKEAEKLNKQKEKNAAKAEAKKAKNEKKNIKKNANKNFGYNFIKSLLITSVCVIFIGTVVTVVSSIAFSFMNDVLVIDKEGKNYSVTVEIPEGATYDEIFDILVDNGVVNQPLLTDLFCKFRHYNYYSYIDEQTGETVKEYIEYAPGVYQLDADSGIENILDSMLVYNNVEKDTVTVTFPEGWTIPEIFEKLEKYEVCDAEKLYANLDIVANQFGFISEIADNEGRYRKAEGYLFPDTYDFYIDEGANSVLEKLFGNFSNRWLPEYDERLKELGLTKDQVITIASIIQGEAKDGSQMAAISGVIHNRLNNSASYPTLDMDSTADYVKTLKSYNILSEVHYSMYLESYNTYSQIGLPPGPICNPGETAIYAALYPDESNYYFFCHDTTSGEIYLASTATEHQENVERVVYGNVGEAE